MDWIKKKLTRPNLVFRVSVSHLSIIFQQVCLVLIFFSSSWSQYSAWKYTGSFFINTTKDGADLLSTASEIEFPVLFRIHKDFFNFSQTKCRGEDIRFSTPSGQVLKYQIDSWDSLGGVADVWIKIPKIEGNQRQEVKMHWGNETALSESNGKSVFSVSNGFVSVMHLSDPKVEEVGTHIPKDLGSQSVSGVAGKARSFDGNGGINAGENISGFPQSGESHTTSFWVKPNQFEQDVLAWGEWARLSQLKFRISGSGAMGVDMWWAIGNVAGIKPLEKQQWNLVHLVYELGNTRMYLNGELDVINTNKDSPLTLPILSKYGLGGNFKGELDEARISKGIRSPHWVKLEFQNQRQFNILTGPLVVSGTKFDVVPVYSEVEEGKSILLKAEADGAHKVIWMYLKNGKEEIYAVDRFNLESPSIRVRGDSLLNFRFKAIYPNETKVKDFQIKIKEAIPDPKFDFQLPISWNGKDTLVIRPNILNLSQLTLPGMPNLKYVWNFEGVAVIQNSNQNELKLIKALGSGMLRLHLSISNGDSIVSVSKETQVKLSGDESDWVRPLPEIDEKPINNQFFGRDKNNQCIVYLNGAMSGSPDSVILRVYQNATLGEIKSQKLSSARYSFMSSLTAGLHKYKMELISKKGQIETLAYTAKDLLCGDVFLLEGQSNTVANDFGDAPINVVDSSDWIWTYNNSWRKARYRWNEGAIGLWGFEMARKIVANHKVPVAIINGAVGGTPISAHLKGTQIFNNLLSRIKAAKLTHAVRAAFWHQGEADQGYDGPSGRLAWLDYEKNFKEMTAAWKGEFPNLQYYYMFQIFPGACMSVGLDAENALREAQRNMSQWYTNLSIMTTLGVRPGSACHYPAAGYQKFADLITPLLERDMYGKKITQSITAPNLKRAFYSSSSMNQIALEFDQEVLWDSKLKNRFFLDSIGGKVVSGRASGKYLYLDLVANSTATKITYLDGRKNWSESEWDNIIWGANGIAAFTFWNVHILKDSTTAFVEDPRNGHSNQNSKIKLVANGKFLRLDYQIKYGDNLRLEVLNLKGQRFISQTIPSSLNSSPSFFLEMKHSGLYYVIVYLNGLKVLSQKQLIQ